MRSLFIKWVCLAAAIIFFGHTARAATDATPSSVPPATPANTAVANVSPQENIKQSDKPESMKLSVVSEPVQVAMVNGDHDKYQANAWQNRGYSGGLKDFSLIYASGDDITVDMSGHAIMGNNDYQADASITKKDVGYLKLNFKQFRKYYDTYGGVYSIYPVFSSNYIDRDLFLDIGSLNVEAGLTRPDLPNVTVYYKHDYKDGSKSMLNWDTVTVGGLNKKISPSWREIDQTTDTFGIKADHTLRGYHLLADQQWEMVRGKNRGYEVRLSNTAGNNQDQRRQDQVIEADVMLSTLGADRWYLGDKFFASSAYRFEHLKNQERQNIQQFTNNGAPNFTQFNKPDGSAHNNIDLNSWVLNLMASPWAWLSGTGRFKAEVSRRDASSFYPTDTTAVIGIIDNNAQTNTDSNTAKFAESTGLRFKAIPRTALYTDLSFEQSQNHLMVNRRGFSGEFGATASDDQSRDAVINEPAATWTMGADLQPVRMINLTSQFRLRAKDMDFDDRFRVRPFNGQVFLETLRTRTAGFNQRVTLRPCHWAQTSFRYLFDDSDYTSRAVYDNVDEKADMLAHTFIYDVSVFPRDNLSLTGSFSKQNAQTKTAAATSPASQEIPAFHSNYYTWMFSTDYQPHAKVSLNSTLFYTSANNYKDFERYNTSSVVYYGADFSLIGLTVGCKWDIRKNLSIQPQYAFNRYHPNQNSGIGSGYDAHIVSVTMTTNWG